MKTTKSNKANLENKRFMFFEVGLILVLAGVLAAFEWTSVSKYSLGDWMVTGPAIEEEMAEVTIHKKEKIEMPKPPVIRAIEVVDNDLKIDEDIEVDIEVKDETVNDLDFIIEDEPDKDVEENVVFTVVEDTPKFRGGDAAFYKYLKDNIEYPQIARESNIEGKVYVEFVVWKDGSVRDVSVKRGIGGGCDEEAVRVISSMPDWEPGKQRTIPVSVRMVLPVSFKLN